MSEWPESNIRAYPLYGIQVRLHWKHGVSYPMTNQNRMHETVHLPSSPTVLSVKTAPWFLRQERGGANQWVTLPSCGVRVVRARVCEQDKEPDKTKKKVKSWGIVGLEQLRKWREEEGTSQNKEIREGRVNNTRAHTLPNLIFQTFHSHCAGFFVPSQTAFCCDDGRSCCHTINYSFLMETNRFFVPIVFGGINRSLEAFILLPLHWTGWQNTGSRL